MKLTAILLILSVLSIVSTCRRELATEPGEVKVRALTQSEKQVALASDEFGLDLFNKVVADGENSNVFISPLSVSMALGMTLNGAAGETRTAMQKTLNFGDMSADEINGAYASLIQLLRSIDPLVQFEIANSMWTHVDFPVRQEFINTNKTFFDAMISALDFRAPAALKTINGWVDQKTHGKIDKIIDTIPPDVVMYLINAIYFKGTWTFEFNKKETNDETFFVTENERVQAPFMRQTNDSLPYFENDLLQMIDLPYGNRQFSMTIILPRNNKSVSDIVSQLDGANWTTWLGSLRRQKGTIQMPKFKLEYKKSLPDVLSAMGMGIAFSDAADFSGINAEKRTSISDVIHKTFVDVYEEGTEAAAVTAVEISLTSVGPSQGFFMRVDRPFIFTIREKSSGTILFIGQVIRPV
ncbi:serpin family protein [candidate division KSB1 bacterium]|nr:serpin family protein [candidate division KSB1 bacterium]RQW05637.1 MAG: serpin family protein [candidate division KSB1 bacterium]